MSLKRWTKEVLFTSGDEYFAHLLRAITDSKSSIEFESYIFEKGALADQLVESLISARKRGVKVRIVVDGWGSPGFVHDYYPSLKAADIQVRFFRVIPWMLKRLPGDPRNFLRRLFLRWRQVNRGNHRKFCLIDHHELWVGSFNVSDVHLRSVSGNDAWQDMGVCVRGPEVRFALRAFRRAFSGWSVMRWPLPLPKLILLNDSLLHARSTRREHIRRLRDAKERIWLSTPYFVPIGTIYRQLVRQAKRGVDVRLMVPSKNDVWLINYLSFPLLRDLSRKGIKVFIFEPRFSHQKVFISDSWISVGSSNLNHRSFLHDLEMDVVITHEDNRQKILEGYIRDQALSKPFDDSPWAKLPLWKRVLGSIFLVLRYWA